MRAASPDVHASAAVLVAVPRTGSDWGWWGAWAGFALLVAYVPLLVAACCGPADLTGLGTFWFVNDFSQYESAMRQGASNRSWLIFNHFTPEPHSPALMFTAYVALGKLAGLLGLDLMPLYRAFELSGRVALLLGVRSFLRAMLPATGEQRLAAILTMFAMGLGIPLGILGALIGVAIPHGGYSYEVNTFGLLFSVPHAALAMGITLWVVGRLTGSRQGRASTECALLALAGLSLALLHPFHLPALLVGLGLGLLPSVLTRLRWRSATGLAALSGGAMPVLLYDLATFGNDPFWSATYGRQNVLPSPALLELPIEFGVLLILAVPGAVVAWRRGGAWRVMLAWLVILVAASEVPVPYQRRLSFGIAPVVATLAAVGLFWVTQRAGKRGASLVRVLALGLAFVSTAAVWGGIIVSALQQAPLRPYRADIDSAMAVEFLAQRACERDVVLANWDLSNYVAGQSMARVIGGHPVATLDTIRRKEIFLAADRDPARWNLLAEQFRPSYVLHGPREKGMAAPGGSASIVFERPSATLYQLGASRCG